MARSFGSLEERVTWLADEMLILKEQVQLLDTRLQMMGSASKSGDVPEPADRQISNRIADNQPVGESLNRMGRELVPRVSAVSFMLVVALVLRTVTDNGMLPPHLGIYTGLVYAVGLICSGTMLYKRQSSLAPVFPACGILLFYAVLMEGFSKFAAMGITTTYLVLLAATVAVALIALRFRATVLLFLTIWGSSVAGFVIDFSEPQFVFLGLLVLSNVIWGHLAKKRGISTVLRWNTFILSAVFWAILSFKLNFALLSRPEDLPAVSLNYFPPLLFLFWAFYTYTTLWTIRAGRMAGDIFHHVIPVIVAGGVFSIAYAVIIPWLGGEMVLGFSAVLCSALYMGVVAWLSKHYGELNTGKEFVVAAILLLVQGLSILVPAYFAMPIMVVAATVLLVRSQKWHSAGCRVIAYFFQIGVILWGFAYRIFAIPEVVGGEAAISWNYGILFSAFWAVCALWCYRWCRLNPPDINGGFFNFIDRDDRSAVVLLLIGLYQIYAVLHFAAFGILANNMTDYTTSLYCARSIILNLGVIVLMLVGLKLRSKEILITAFMVVIIAAVKVFLFDLFRTDGMPLVLSVLTFGMVAAVTSVVLRKWGAGNGK